MRLVIQRVKKAQVEVDGEIVARIGSGVLAFLGIRKGDTAKEISWMAKKLVDLRIFRDEQGKMNQSIKDIGGEILVVSQFTLYGNCTSGRRPDFFSAAPPAQAKLLYEQYVSEVKKEIPTVQTGVFGAMMEVALVNDGPVTLVVDTPNLG